MPTGRARPGPLPRDFAAQLAALLDPGQTEAAAAVIAEAAWLDDERLGVFLESFAARVRRSSMPVTAGELDRLLAAARGAGSLPPSAAPSSSPRRRVPSPPSVAPSAVGCGRFAPLDPGSRI